MRRHALAPLLAILSSVFVLTLWACTPTRPVVSPTLNGAALLPPTQLSRLTFSRTDGGTFSASDTAGRTSLFYFGYTHWPDMCPLTLAEFGQIRRALGPDAAGLD